MTTINGNGANLGLNPNYGSRPMLCARTWTLPSTSMSCWG